VGTVTHGTLTVDGRERTYRLYVPKSLSEGPVPLFIGLHGGTGWADQFATTNHIEGLAESNGFVVVHPDGVKVAGGDGRGGVWNGGMCCGVASRDEIDDVHFIEALLDELAGEIDFDARRVFAFGHSNGGIMSYRLACELANRVVGIGVVAGTLGVEQCQPERPVSVLHIHGTADENLPLAGGVGPRSAAGVSFPPPVDGFATLAEADGCGTPREITDGAITTARRAPCDGGAEMAFVTIEGASHAWPGGTPLARPASGDGYADYDATAEIVGFLLAHPRL
jgi:polyhydroxybutyrate depolymerase